MLISSYIITQYKIETIKQKEYQNYSNYIQSKLNIMIENKQKSTTFIALSLAQNKTIIEALQTKDNSSIDISYLSQIINEKSSYKNLWYQIIDLEGKSFYRSWTKKTGDLLKDIRPEIHQTLQNQTTISTISTGKFAMTFKTMVPIYDDKKQFLGIFEVISHFNSISKKLLKDENIHALFLVDKKYKKQLTRPFTKTFIGDYYLTSLDPNLKILSLLEKNGVEYYLNLNNDFQIYNDTNYLVVPYTITDINNNPLGYALNFKNLQDIEPSKAKYLQDYNATIMIALIFIISLFGYLFIVRKHQKEILAQHLKHEQDMIKSTKFLTIGQMAAGITHEINTPLTYIKGTIEMAQKTLEELPQSESKKFLQEDMKVAYDGVKRIAMIVESMKEMSQSALLEKEKVNVYATLITVLRMLHNKSKQISKIYINNKAFELETSNKQQEQYFANIHTQRIEQVWTIILNNSLDELVKIPEYEHRRIDINIFTNQDKLIIKFLDNAGGVSTDLLPKVFEPFVSTKASSGIGIGLNVAKKIIEEHEGDIEVHNTDAGACFTITLDLYQEDI